MFPVNWNDPVRNKDGTLGTIEELGRGGGGGSFTPDYENDRLIIGVHGDYNYYVPMLKEYAGSGIAGYEIKTDPETTSSRAIIDLYSIVYDDGEIIEKTLIKKLVHNGDKNYEDNYISVTYSGTNWSVTSKVPLYNENGVVYESPLNWNYSDTVDYLFLTEDPTA